MNCYQQMIAKITAADPRYVEAWMRVYHGTLDNLTTAQFNAEVGAAARCADESSDHANEALCRSFGL